MDVTRDIREHERIDSRALDAMRRLGGAGRLRAMSDLIDSMRMLMAARVREQHPDWSPEQIAAETARRVSRANA